MGSGVFVIFFFKNQENQNFRKKHSLWRKFYYGFKLKKFAFSKTSDPKYGILLASDVLHFFIFSFFMQIQNLRQDLQCRISLRESDYNQKLICCSAQEQQIWKIVSREILNLSLKVKFCISKNMAPFLYVFRTGPCSQKCKFMHSETD